MRDANIELIKFFVEIGLSLVLLLAIAFLRWQNSIEERTFLIALVLWGLFFPSPHQWAISIGNWLNARKNGGLVVDAAQGKRTTKEGAQDELQGNAESVDVENACS